MTLRYLVDTDWVIHYVNGQPEITRRLNDLQAEGLGLSVISLAELYEGVYYSRDPAESEKGVDGFLRVVSLVGLDPETARLFGRERGRLRAIGRTVADLDLLIGATALRHDLTLLTNNRRHFETIEDLRIESQQ
jgi:tRNA(fMet)-specific endonuclease VapC